MADFTFGSICARFGRLGCQGAALRRTGRLSLAGLVLLGLTSCTVGLMPIKEGPAARLIAGIKEPRDRNEMDITIYKYPVTAWGKCLELASSRAPVSAVLSVVTLSPFNACAIVPKDHELDVGERPWCIVAVPEGDEELLEHELRHCEGWAAPNYSIANKPEDEGLDDRDG